MFLPFHPGFVLCSPSVLAPGSFESQTDIKHKASEMLEFTDIDRFRAVVS